MNAAVYAELTADSERIIVMGAGPVEGLAYLGKQLEQLTPLIKPTDPKGGLYLPVSWPAVVQLSATYGQYYVPGPRLQSWTMEQATQRTVGVLEPLTAPIADNGMTPWPHQIDGAKLIAATGRALIFDEQRTGKSITTILGLAERRHRGLLNGPILIVCPGAVIDPWLEAIEDWAPTWRAVSWSDAKRKGIDDADVYVTSYHMARRDAQDTNPKMSPLIKLDAPVLVVDEMQETKTQGSQQSHAVRRLARHVKEFVALSGTPITHHTANLWPTLVCLDPHAWPARDRWVNRYCSTRVADYGEGILGLDPGMDAEFRIAILGQNRRVARADLGWAPKSYDVHQIEMPPEYRKTYDDFEEEMLAELPDGQELSVMDVLTQMTCLRTLAGSATDVEITWTLDEATGEQKRHIHLELKEPSWVVDALISVLNARGREQTVAFSDSAQLCRIAGRRAAAAGFRVGYIIGGQTRKKRTETRKAFQRGELDLVCATVGAGGVGITLNAAKTLIFLERPWSIVKSMQAEDRGVGDINAPGCHIIDIVVANTVYARVRAVLRERAGQLSDLLQDPRIVAELLGGASVRQLRKVS